MFPSANEVGRIPPMAGKAADNLAAAVRFGLDAGFITDDAAALISKLSEALRKVPVRDERIASGHQPLHTRIETNWTYAALVPIDDEDEELHQGITALRAMLFGWRAKQILSLRDDPNYVALWTQAASFRTSYQKAVGRLCRPAEWQLEVMHELSPYLAASLREGCIPELRLTRLRAWIDDKKSSAFESSLHALRKGLSAIRPTFDRTWSIRRRTVPIEGQDLNGQLEETDGLVELSLPAEGPKNQEPDDVRELRYFQNPTLENEEPGHETAAGRRAAARRFNKLSLEGALIPGGRRTLDAGEATWCVSQLKRLSEEGSPAQRLQACILALTAATGRTFEVIAAVLRGEFCDHLSIDVAAGRWQTTLPADAGATSSRDAELAPYLYTTSCSVWLPLPVWVKTAIEKLHPADLRYAGLTADDALVEALNRAMPRFTPARLRAFMAAQVSLVSEDTVLAQALNSDRLGQQSDASLHYFSMAVERVMELYREAMTPILGALYSVPLCSGQRFGMEFPAVRAETVRALAMSLKPSLLMPRHALESDTDLDGMAAAISALSMYSYFFLLAASGMRPTDRAALNRIPSFYLDAGIAVIEDKRCDVAHAFRVIAFGREAADQLRTYTHELARFELLLKAAREERRRDALLKAVTAALVGEGPLFLMLGDEGFRAIVTRDMAERMPAGLPANLLRHRFDAQAREVGITGLEACDLAGRYFLGAPFTLATLETPVTMARRLQQSLDRMTRNDGWQVTGPAGSYPAGASRFEPDAGCLEAQRRIVERIRAENRSALFATKKLSVGADGRRRDAIINDELARVLPLREHGEPVEVTEAMVRKVVTACAKQLSGGADSLAAIRSGLCQILMKRKADHGWSVALPKVLYREHGTLPAVTPPVLSAYRFLWRQREQMWQQADEFKARPAGAPRNTIDPLTVFAAEITLLGVIDPARLDQACRALARMEILASVVTDGMRRHEGVVVVLPLTDETAHASMRVEADNAAVGGVEGDDEGTVGASASVTSCRLDEGIKENEQEVEDEDKGDDRDEDKDVDKVEDENDDEDNAIARKPASITLAGRALIAAAEARRYLAGHKVKCRSGAALRAAVARALLPEAVITAYKGKDAWTCLTEIITLARPLVRPGPPALASPVGAAITLPALRIRQVMLEPALGRCSEFHTRTPAESKGKLAARRASIGRGGFAIVTLLRQTLAAWDRLPRKVDVKGIADRPVAAPVQPTPALGEAANATDAGAAALRPACEAAIEPMKIVQARQAALAALLERAVAADAGNLALVIRWLMHLVARNKRAHARHYNGRRPVTDGLRQRLQMSSVRRYASTILVDLVAAGADVKLASLSTENLEDVYIRFLLCKSPSGRRYAFDRIREFHAFSLRQITVDWALIADELPDDVREPEPGIVSERELRRAHDQLRLWSSQQKRALGAQFGAARYDMADVALTLMARAGLRIGEVARVRFIDITDLAEAGLWLSVNGRLGHLKSLAGRRHIDLAATLDAFERGRLREWLTAERERQQRLGVYRDINPVFAAADGWTPMGRDYLIAGVQAALVCATGCRDARPHWLRHLRAQSLLASTLFDTRLLRGLALPRTGDLQGKSVRIVAVWIARHLGHAEISTTLRSYYHLQHFHDAEEELRRLAGLPDRDWRTGSGISREAHRQWRSRWRREHSFSLAVARPEQQRIAMAKAWTLHVARSCGLLPNPVRQREAALVTKLPYRVPKPPPFGAAEAIGLLCAAASDSTEQLCAHFGIERGRLTVLLESLLKLSLRSREWVLGPSRLHDLLSELGSRDLEGLQRLASNSQALQLNAIVRQLKSTNYRQVGGMIGPGGVRHMLEHYSSDHGFLAIGSEAAAAVEILTGTGFIGTHIRRRHSYAMLLAAFLAFEPAVSVAAKSAIHHEDG